MLNTDHQALIFCPQKLILSLYKILHICLQSIWKVGTVLSALHALSMSQKVSVLKPYTGFYLIEFTMSSAFHEWLSMLCTLYCSLQNSTQLSLPPCWVIPHPPNQYQNEINLRSELKFSSWEGFWSSSPYSFPKGAKLCCTQRETAKCLCAAGAFVNLVSNQGF